jgi:Protein of unknown function (DUF3168)
MADSSPLKIQKAVYDKMVAYAALVAAVEGIYDDIPASESFPYIFIGRHTTDRFNTFDKQGKNMVLQIFIYSQYQGNKQALEILDLVIEALDYQTFTIATQTLVYCRYEQHSMYPDPDGRTKVCAADFRIIAQET